MVCRRPIWCTLHFSTHKGCGAHDWQERKPNSQLYNPTLRGAALQELCCKLVVPNLQAICTCSVLVKLQGHCHSLLSLRLTFP
jgi:hypothetical protein